MGGDALLEVRGLTVRAGERTVVDRVSFDVRAREIVAVIGPNGAGKTTLLESVVGVRAITRGAHDTRVAGRALRTFAERAASFAFAPDDALPAPEPLVAHANACRPRDPALLARIQRDLRIDPLLRFFKVVKGKRTVFDNVRSVPTPSKTWHTLVADLRGRQLTATLDGQKRLDKTLDFVPTGRGGARRARHSVAK